MFKSLPFLALHLLTLSAHARHHALSASEPGTAAPIQTSIPESPVAPTIEPSINPQPEPSTIERTAVGIRPSFTTQILPETEVPSLSAGTDVSPDPTSVVLEARSRGKSVPGWVARATATEAPVTATATEPAPATATVIATVSVTA